MWFVGLLLCVIVLLVLEGLCEWLEIDEFRIFRSMLNVFVVGLFLMFSIFAQCNTETTWVSNFTGEAKTTIPNKIVRDAKNNYYIIEKNLDKIPIDNIELKKEGKTQIVTKEYSQNFFLLDWMLFDFTEDTLELNINDDIELVE